MKKNKILLGLLCVIMVIVSIVVNCFLFTAIGIRLLPEENIKTATLKETVGNCVPTVQKEEVKLENTTIKLTFVGDTMLASYKDITDAGNFNDYANKKEPSYFLEKVRPYFENDDFTIANLENVFSDSDVSPIYKNHSPAYWFKSRTSNTQILTSSSVEGVSLANNHIKDYGETGKNDTINAVKSAGLLYGSEEVTMYLEKDGFKIAVICTGLWGSWETDAIIDRIKEAEEQSDYQIIFFHGGTERLHAPEEWKKESVHKMIDNGADLVIGGHPHVLQPKEIYNGVEIIYSLGNFCYGGHTHPENRTIIYQIELNINIANKNINSQKSEIIPCYVYTGEDNNFQPAEITNPEEKQKVLDFMEGKTDLPY